MARLSRRTIARVQTWVDKQKTSKLRKILTDGWVYDREPREVEDLSDEEVRETLLEDIQCDDEQVEAVLESIGVEPEYSDDDGDDDNDFDDSEE